MNAAAIATRTASADTLATEISTLYAHINAATFTLLEMIRRFDELSMIRAVDRLPSLTTIFGQAMLQRCSKAFPAGTDLDANSLTPECDSKRPDYRHISWVLAQFVGDGSVVERG